MSALSNRIMAEADNNQGGRVSGDLPDISKLVLGQQYLGAMDVTKKLQIAVRKPSKETFFRVHPQMLTSAPIGLYHDKGNEDDAFYFVVPDMMPELDGHAYPAVLRLGVTTDGRAFIWPLRLAGPDGVLNDWWRTAMLAADEAEKAWVSLRPNKKEGRYDIMVAASQNRPPAAWPEQSFDELVKAGFGDRIIANAEHPISKRLRGAL
jgi:hypothetical protein